MWRHLPPVHSPLTLPAIWRGVKSAVRTSSWHEAQDTVLEELSARQSEAELLLLDGGTSALALAIKLALLDSGKAVAIPGYGCFDLATAVDAAGCPFVLYDLDPLTLGPDLASLQRALTADVGAVVVAHLYGIPVDMPAIRAIAATTGAHVIDDAAQGVGGAVAGLPLGSAGALGVLSFGRGKGLTGGGGGALVIPRGSPLAEVARRLAVEDSKEGWGRAALSTLAQWMLARPTLYGIPASLPFLELGETVYRSPERPHAISRFAVGVLAETLGLAAPEAERRRLHAAAYSAAVPRDQWHIPHPPMNSLPGFLRYPVLLPDAMRAQHLGAEARRLGIMPGYPRSLAELESFGSRRRLPELSPEGSRLLAERLITLPTHGAVRPGDLDAVLRWIDRSS